MVLKKMDLKVNAELLALGEPERYESFSVIEVCWDTIPLFIRRRIAKTFPNLYYEFDDDWFYSAFVIPHKKGQLDYKHMYLYCNRYDFDNEDINEVKKFVLNQDTYLCNNFEAVELSALEQVRLLSEFIPSVDFRA